MRSMRPSVPLLEVYGHLEDISLHISKQLGGAVINYSLEGKKGSLLLERPQPLAALISVIDEYSYGFRIYDRNAEEPNQLEFGRYRAEFWDEDGPVAECIADRFEVRDSE